VLPEVAESMMPWLTTKWGNPYSNHMLGREARRAVENARTSVAALLGADPSQVIFTSGAPKQTMPFYTQRPFVAGKNVIW